jgi:hypothetical protein
MRISKQILSVAWLVLGCSPRTDELASKDTAAAAPAATSANTVATHNSDTISPKTFLSQLWETGEDFGENRTQIQSKLGDALEVRVEETKNRHGPWIDSVFTFRFAQTEVDLLRAGYDGKEIVRSITLWDSDRKLPGDLQIGQSSRQKIEASLGRPDTVSQIADTLQLKYYLEDMLLMHVIRDTLRMVEWSFYVD